MRTSRLTLVFLGGLVLALILTAPAALAGRTAGLKAEQTQGTIWDGQVTGAAYGDAPLGDLRLRLPPLSLLSGRPRIALASSNGPVAGSLQFFRGRGGAGIEEGDLTAPLSLLGGPAQLDGVLRTRGLAVRFEGAICRQAAGRLLAEIGGLGDERVRLEGSAGCRDGAFAAVLQGDRRGAKVELQLEVTGDGRYRTRLTVGEADPLRRAALAQAGFLEGAGGMWRVSEGRLR